MEEKKVAEIVNAIKNQKIPEEEEKALEFYYRIIEARKRKGWTRKELAEKSNIGENRVMQIETMVPELEPTLMEVLKLCKSLDINVTVN